MWRCYKQQAESSATLEAQQEGDHSSIRDLVITQQTVQGALTTAQASVKVKAAAVASHTQAWKDLNEFLTEQST